MIGDGQPFVVGARSCSTPRSRRRGRRATGIDTAFDAAGRDPEVLAEVEREVDEANERFSHVERIKRLALLADEWLPDSEELTPTMKLKRRGDRGEVRATRSRALRLTRTGAT